MMNNVKRVLCLCLAAALVAAAVPVMAAGTATFAVSEAAGNPGDTVTITVSTQNNPGIIGLQLAVHYDANVLELKNAEGGAFSGVAFGPLGKNPFSFNWVDAIHPDNTTNGVLATLTFAIKSTAPAGKTEVSVSYNPEDVFNLAWEDVTFATKAGGVTVGGNNSGTAQPPAQEDIVLHSVTESDGADRGLGFLFTVPATGAKMVRGSTADFSAATVPYQGNDCALLRVGALLTTDAAVGGNADKMLPSAKGVTDVAVTSLWDTAADACTYAVRLKNIPQSAVGSTVYARPYYVVRYQGKEVVVYGDIDATTYMNHR